jgi:hypothetical protein
MKVARVLPVAMLTLAISWSALAQSSSPMRPGNWEVTVKMNVPGLPMDMPPIKHNECVTAAMLKDPQSAVPKGGVTGEGANDCRVSDYKLAGNTATWRLTCTKPTPITGTGEIVYAGDTYKGTMTLDMAGQKMAMSYDARRIGDCTK